MRLRSSLGMALRLAAAAIEPDPEPVDAVPLVVPVGLNGSWADDDKARDERRNLALVALADHTVAIFAVAMTGEADEYDTRLLGDVPQEFWPALTITLDRVVKEGKCRG